LRRPSLRTAPAFSPKNTFRNICGFCHENYGRKAGKGPQLMGSQLSDEQIFDRIKNGKPGRMAAFGGNFTDDQIHQLVAFIRALRPDVESSKISMFGWRVAEGESGTC